MIVGIADSAAFGAGHLIPRSRGEVIRNSLQADGHTVLLVGQLWGGDRGVNPSWQAVRDDCIQFADSVGCVLLHAGDSQLFVREFLAVCGKEKPVFGFSGEPRGKWFNRNQPFLRIGCAPNDEQLRVIRSWVAHIERSL